MIRAARLFVCLGLAVGSFACVERVDTPPLLNRCTQPFECARPAVCDPQLGMCVRNQVMRPYSVALQVTPPSSGPNGMLTRTVAPDAGVLQGSFNYGVIRVRRAQVVSGSVFDAAMTSFEAEVAFIPHVRSYLAGGLSAFSAPLNGVSPKTYGFSAALEPDTLYEVRVFPTGPDSERLPPASFMLSTQGLGTQVADFVYPRQQTLSARLLDEGQNVPTRVAKLRLRNATTKQVVSSIGKLDKQSGAFDIDAPADVMANLADHELVLEIKVDGEPQSVTLAFDASLVRQGATLVMPVLPDPVVFSGSVEVDNPVDKGGINADVTFVSKFAVPLESGDLRGRDWCRLRLPGSLQGTFHCSAMVKASAARDHLVTATLLPGDYQVFVAPNGDIQDPLRVATNEFKESIGSQDGGVQGARVFTLQRAVVYAGSVSGPLGEPMPGVSVTAGALGIQYDLPEVAQYNRTAQQITDRHGHFQLAVDTGIYDLLAVPPEQSGFAWMLNYNRRQAPATGNMPAALPIAPQTPVIARGLLLTDESRPVGQARVEAFAIVPDLETGADRAVRVASTRSDGMGNFALALPPFIGEPPTDDTPNDAATPSAQNTSSATATGPTDAGLPDAH